MSELETIEQVLDSLSKDIVAQQGYGNTFYQHTLENIRAALQELNDRTKRRHPFRGVAWLIECSFESGRPEYYCGPSEWCSNPYHAHKFPTKEAADEASNTMTTIGDRRVTDHSWE